MQKQVVEISWGECFAAQKSCYHSYLRKSHERWMKKIERQEVKRAWAEARKARIRQRIEEEKAEIEEARLIKEQQECEWQCEKRLREDIIRDVIGGKRPIDHYTYGVAETIDHPALGLLSHLMMEEFNRNISERDVLWRIHEFFEMNELWDFVHPPRKRKWWR
ncbi:MAG: hypothetical protein PHP25_05500 [Candidatus Moranbacteria bacterium]|nr:hypothetical protein [Candidatus Moranbacteria bacterium]